MMMPPPPLPSPASAPIIKTPNVHSDFITDASYDHYGNFLATCSLDNWIKIWGKNAEGSAWTERAKMDAGGPAEKLCWADPDFGTLLATCDGFRLSIWEERHGDDFTKFERTWEKTITREKITGLAFAPKHLGLRLAMCTIEGTIYVYTSDPSRQAWTERESFKAPHDVSCMAWNTYAFDAPSLVVSSKMRNCATVWRYDEARKRWRLAASLDNDSAGIRGGHRGAVNFVSWCPNLGKSFHTIATASSDGSVKIWRLARTQSGSSLHDASILGTTSTAGGEDEDNNMKSSVEVECLETLDHVGEQVWKAEWNATGAVLATSFGECSVRLYSQNFKGKWQVVGEMKDDDDGGDD